MREDNKELDLGKYWPFWGMHFGFHIMIGLLANIGGIVIIFTGSGILNGLALAGAGCFAIINGWQGFVELRKNEVNQRYTRSKDNNQ